MQYYIKVKWCLENADIKKKRNGDVVCTSSLAMFSKKRKEKKKKSKAIFIYDFEFMNIWKHLFVQPDQIQYGVTNRTEAETE